MKPITPHLWFDKQAKQAAEFYVTVFPDSKITHRTVLKDTPSGDCDVMSFQLAGHPFMAISAGPYFTLNPAISFMVNYDPSRDPQAGEHLDEAWAKLAEGGTVRMPLQEYPFSKRYGWIQDRFGVNWQLILTNPAGEPRPFIIPTLLFTQAVDGKAEEATDFYLSVFADSPESKRGAMNRNPDGTVLFTDFMLAGTWFAAMDGGPAHKFAFNEAVSLMVPCDTQEEIDAFWSKLSAVPASEQCGWLKDKYGLSWQITSTAMDEMLTTGTPTQIARVTQAFLKMKKFDVGELKRVFEGE